MTLEQISEEALELPQPERALLVERLQESLGGSDGGLSPAWADTVLRRRDELRSGKVKGIPAEEVFARAEKIERSQR